MREVLMFINEHKDNSVNTHTYTHNNIKALSTLFALR